GLNSTISLLLFSRLRFNSHNPSKQKRHPQTDPPNAALAASFNRQIELQENSGQTLQILQCLIHNFPQSASQINALPIVHARLMSLFGQRRSPSPLWFNQIRPSTS
ncbi:hypothetical protein, partial [Mesorhizobium sp. M1E.F.Ca.ET.063.01.1.1]|uniref:hypothetical protein n=1 Tax=Mesorhizobium sp. M1E.F.Ca.ET.063.01.1.1 TaxID=2496750 RepID=UPI001AEC8357